jgi:2-oxoglutarate dehydrogenase E1 component
MERFLMLAAEDNLQVAVPTTPAQYFHLLRRQVLRTWRKPLVIMTPKSLLRSPKATSSVAELATGRFRRILRDRVTDPAKVTRILLCAGKIYYDLEDERDARARNDVAILRFEQLYPLRDARIANALKVYREGTPAIWVQEEPENSGAWRHLAARFGQKALGRFPFSGIHRDESASPATGSGASHVYEQKQLIERAFGD